MLLTESKIKQHLSEGLQHHLDSGTPLWENVFRSGSEKYFSIIKEARHLLNKGLLTELCYEDMELLFETEVGEYGQYEGNKVPLDYPMLDEAEYKGRDVDLNKPSRSSGPTKYKVYVKNDKGNVVVVNFGDKKGGLSAKINDKAARKSFAARHKCSTKKDKTKAGYWSCRIPRYAKLLGMKSDFGGYW